MRWELCELLGKGAARTSWMLVEGEERSEIRGSEGPNSKQIESPAARSGFREQGTSRRASRKQHGKRAGTWEDWKKEPDWSHFFPDSGQSVWNTLDAGSRAVCFVIKWSFCRKNACSKLIFILFSSCSDCFQNETTHTQAFHSVTLERGIGAERKVYFSLWHLGTLNII